MSCTSNTTSLGSPVVQNLAQKVRAAQRKKTDEACTIPHPATRTNSTHHAWPLDEPCRTDAMATAPASRDGINSS
jgi:hypothetical protein